MLLFCPVYYNQWPPICTISKRNPEEHLLAIKSWRVETEEINWQWINGTGDGGTRNNKTKYQTTDLLPFLEENTENDWERGEMQLIAGSRGFSFCFLPEATKKES